MFWINNCSLGVQLFNYCFVKIVVLYVALECKFCCEKGIILCHQKVVMETFKNQQHLLQILNSKLKRITCWEWKWGDVSGQHKKVWNARKCKRNRNSTTFSSLACQRWILGNWKKKFEQSVWILLLQKILQNHNSSFYKRVIDKVDSSDIPSQKWIATQEIFLCFVCQLKI